MILFRPQGHENLLRLLGSEVPHVSQVWWPAATVDVRDLGKEREGISLNRPYSYFYRYRLE